MKQKAWSTLAIKSVDEERRIITGVASTPSTDRAGDIVEPMGAQFDLPLPFCWQHNHIEPVGNVTSATPNKDGIPVEIQIANVAEPGTLKDRLDEAWQSIKAKLVRGLSIGFAPLEYSFIDDTGGMRFTKWAWLELSAVTIPCNTEATIQTIKRYDSGGLLTPAAKAERSWHPFDLMKGDGSTIPSDELVAHMTGRARALLKEIKEAGSPFERFAMLAANVIMHQSDALYVANAHARLRKRVESLEERGDTLAALCDQAIALQKRVSALETRLEQRSYQGVYQPGEKYFAENSVTHKGSLFIARADTTDEPGTSDDWQLAVKRGRDAR
jgi:uncharacterized protein